MIGTQCRILQNVKTFNRNYRRIKNEIQNKKNGFKNVTKGDLGKIKRKKIVLARKKIFENSFTNQDIKDTEC